MQKLIYIKHHVLIFSNIHHILLCMRKVPQIELFLKTSGTTDFATIVTFWKANMHVTCGATHFRKDQNGDMIFDCGAYRF